MTQIISFPGPVSRSWLRQHEAELVQTGKTFSIVENLEEYKTNAKSSAHPELIICDFGWVDAVRDLARTAELSFLKTTPMIMVYRGIHGLFKASDYRLNIIHHYDPMAHLESSSIRHVEESCLEKLISVFYSAEPDSAGVVTEAAFRRSLAMVSTGRVPVRDGKTQPDSSRPLAAKRNET